MIGTYAEARMRAFESAHLPLEYIGKDGWESSDLFLVDPAEDAPEGCPGFFVTKKTGGVRKVSVRDIDEIKAFIEDPLTEPVSCD